MDPPSRIVTFQIQPFSTSRNMGVRVTSLIQILCVAVESERLTIEGTNTIISSSSSSFLTISSSSINVDSKLDKSWKLGPPNSRGLLLHLFSSTFAQAPWTHGWHHRMGKSLDLSGKKVVWLVVEPTPLKNISQIGKSSPKFAVKISKNI